MLDAIFAIGSIASFILSIVYFMIDQPVGAIYLILLSGALCKLAED